MKYVEAARWLGHGAEYFDARHICILIFCVFLNSWFRWGVPGLVLTGRDMHRIGNIERHCTLHVWYEAECIAGQLFLLFSAVLDIISYHLKSLTNS